jgi:hypothetical protein
MKLLFSILALCSGTLAFAGGGMIGGGEVEYKPLLVCDAVGIDPTFPSSKYVWVAKEVDFDGRFIPDSTLRVITFNAALEPVRYYVSHEVELLESPDRSRSLSLWRYDIGSQGNQEIGGFNWDETSQTGSLSASGWNSEVEELQLSNCH